MASPPTGFAIGDEVEVICQDEGFKGSLYEARIIRCLQRVGQYTVEYETLTSDARSGKKLRETIKAAVVRPRPPPTGGKSSFEVGDRVDAFHNDGWWVGRIAKVTEDGGKYEVRFTANDDPEELEFGLDQVRVHMDWTNGEWITQRAPIQNSLGMVFREGDVVEVHSNDEGLSGAWYNATIIEANPETCLVEYHNLRTDDDADLLKEIVNPLQIRLIPPDSPVVGNFNLLEEVDAFHNDGWWVGVISEVLEGPRYMVYFKSYDEVTEFGHNELRLHHEWIDGKWQQASKVLGL